MKFIIKNKFISVKFTAVFIFAAAMTACIAGFYGCGIISGNDFDDGESLTFASQNNYIKSDIIVDDIITESVKNNPPPEENTVGNEFPGEQPQDEIIADDLTPTLPNKNNPDIPPPDVPDNPQIKDGVVRMKFLAAGDNIIHQSMIDDAKERAKAGEAFNFKDMYKDIENIIKAADIAFVNMETPIAGDEFPYTGHPNFNTPKENAFAIIDIGFDIINLANNHMLDKWETGYINSLNFWDNQKNIFSIGGFRDKEDFDTVRIYEKNGVTIAFLSYTYSTNGMTLPKDSKMIVPFIEDETVERQVKAARPLADLLFVVMHWGDEDSFTPNQWQKSLAQMMVDNGVDVVIGMHPHVFQEVKWVTRPDGKKTLIAYSIGNLISNMYPARNMVGGLLTFDIIKTTKNGESDTVINNAKIVPVVTHMNMRRKGYQVYRFEDYTEELAKLHGGIDSDSKFSYKYLKDTIVNNIAPEFLSDFYKN